MYNTQPISGVKRRSRQDSFASTILPSPSDEEAGVSNSELSPPRRRTQRSRTFGTPDSRSQLASPTVADASDDRYTRQRTVSRDFSEVAMSPVSVPGSPFRQNTRGKFSQHRRATCHRCANVRKRNVCCSNCPRVICEVCAIRVVCEFGIEAFKDGCPVCKSMCCCADHSGTTVCNRLYHCNRRCPALKNASGVPTPSGSFAGALTEPDATAFKVSPAEAAALIASYISGPARAGGTPTVQLAQSQPNKKKTGGRWAHTREWMPEMGAAVVKTTTPPTTPRDSPGATSRRLETHEQHQLLEPLRPSSATTVLLASPPGTKSPATAPNSTQMRLRRLARETPDTLSRGTGDDTVAATPSATPPAPVDPLLFLQEHGLTGSALQLFMSPTASKAVSQPAKPGGEGMSPYIRHLVERLTLLQTQSPASARPSAGAVSAPVLAQQLMELANRYSQKRLTQPQYTQSVAPLPDPTIPTVDTASLPVFPDYLMPHSLRNSSMRSCDKDGLSDHLSLPPASPQFAAKIPPQVSTTVHDLSQPPFAGDVEDPAFRSGPLMNSFGSFSGVAATPSDLSRRMYEPVWTEQPPEKAVDFCTSPSHWFSPQSKFSPSAKSSQFRNNSHT